MDRMIVVVFDNEKQAYAGSRALAELDGEGSIAVYGASVIHKDAAGQVTILDEGDEGPVGTLSGTLVGSLIGALAGPVGMAVGASLGALGGMWYDLYNSGVGIQFVDDVSDVLLSGKYALVAEIMEEWTAPVDTRMEALGGIVVRGARLTVENNQFEREISAADAELTQLEAEWQQANEETKAKLTAKVEAAREKLNTVRDKAEAKLGQIKKESDERLAVLKAKISKCEGETRQKLEQHVEKMQADYDNKLASLKESWRKTVANVTGGAVVS